ncbi:PIG-L family deacetylase [Flavobacteriaceae bacterium F89]|uniref:PIG-L family deacetylase n=1 Tax=Cerina litoralis TaxID=2874477 RepID=A0AAE3JPT5_9FLAO|nr:PIG-L family deacetylase [Cerina litoralis]MCG2461386.1 PIG-L family deacetylase [Cerina litoralis]
MHRFLVFFLATFFCNLTIWAQLPSEKSSTEIYESIQKLNFLGTALYVGAHPDDENTRLISYLSNETKARVAYLSMTRGDGGQNLIGPELRELLGVLRTEELLAARRIDGGEQFFTRANDFGYSKTPDETFKIWNKNKVLSDVVWVIRNFKPDVIINRFDYRTPGSTHGHHTASAMLSLEAFDKTNNPNAYPEQLKYTQLWQPKRLFFNTSWWFYGNEEKFKKANKSKMISMDIGVYYPLKGLSNTEIAALASSQHRCQGFGRMGSRGTEMEYVELLKGTMPQDGNDIFQGINTTWTRVEGGESIGEILYAVQKNFDFTDPSKHLPQLLEAYKLIRNIPDPHWRALKTKELKDIITEVTGLYLEASASVPNTDPGSNIDVHIEATNRSNSDITLKSITLSPTDSGINTNVKLADNARQTFDIPLQVPANTRYSSPYWLTEKGSLGMYTVNDQKLIGRPETPPAFMAHFLMVFNGYEIPIDRPVNYHFAKPDKGEIYQPFEVLPKATVRLMDKVLIFANGDSKSIPVKVKAGEANIAGTVALKVTEGWRVIPKKIDFSIAQKGDEKTVFFTVTPPTSENEGTISPVVTVDENRYTKELVFIDYDHVPKQSVLQDSQANVVRLNIKKVGESIGYIMGAGDEIPESLRQIGYNVRLLDPKNMGPESLSKYDAVVVGIRAYNVLDELKFKQHILMDYVKNGGNLIVQYNTAGRNDPGLDHLSPYPLTLSRDRVTDENSPVKILDPENSLVNFPNKITRKDFDGWVQERGLYFPNSWGKEFTPIFSMWDQGESPKKGSLLVAPYGKGHYIYTGLSFFRELPAGVPGAYRIFANMLSAGKEKLENQVNLKG